MEKIIKAGVGVLIFDERGRLLLGRRALNAVDTGGIYEPGSWNCPGGKQEYDETIVEAAIREVKEETNLDISNVESFGASDDVEDGKHFVNIHLIAKSYSGTLKVMEPEKIDIWEWFPLDELPENLYSSSRETINFYLKNIKKEGEI
ncbi:MAG: NUDIX domain-containing protein [Bacilli bacterium]|nr:NUDIX domain-containing protein [Bacilli bacterium]